MYSSKEAGGPDYLACPNCNGRMKPMYGDERGQSYRCVECGHVVPRSQVGWDEDLQRMKAAHYAEADERAKQVIPSHFKASRTDRFKQTVQANLGRL
jgi:DNA-directed RNA polymerase subunit RPC12/RpoP